MNTNVFFDATERVGLEPIEIGNLTKAEILPASSIILAVKVRNPGFERQLKDNESEQVLKKVDSKYLTTTKKLLDKKYLAPIAANGGELRRKLYQVGFRPSFLADGSVVVPKGLLNYALQMVEDYKNARNELVGDLKEAWEQAKLEAKVSNPDLYDESQYPEIDELDDKFAITYTLLAVGMPDVAEYLDADVVMAQQKEYSKQMTEAMDEIKQALRAGFTELVDGMVDKVRGVGSERRTFKRGFVEKWKIFLDTFDQQNLAGDVELAGLVDKARMILDGVSPDLIRNNLETKARIERELVSIKDVLDTWVEPVKREFTF